MGRYLAPLILLGSLASSSREPSAGDLPGLPGTEGEKRDNVKEEVSR